MKTGAVRTMIKTIMKSYAKMKLDFVSDLALRFCMANSTICTIHKKKKTIKEEVNTEKSER